MPLVVHQADPAAAAEPMAVPVDVVAVHHTGRLRTVACPDAVAVNRNAALPPECGTDAAAEEEVVGLAAVENDVRQDVLVVVVDDDGRR